MFADVIVKTKIPSIGKTFTYGVPEELAPIATIGKMVVVPFGKKNLDGMILRIHQNKPEFEVKEIKQISPEKQILSSQSLDIALWMSIRYSANFFECISPLMPKKKHDKGKEKKLTKTDTLPLETALTLTKEQKLVIKEIIRIDNHEENKKMLLYGVTGSGKTEIYLQYAANILNEEKQVLFLIPEISLTPQLINRFAKRFGKERIAVVHSHIAQSAKALAWKQIQQGEKQIIIGSRSAILSPFNNLGAIIIDECHEQSYKQDKNPKYNAITLAEYLSDTYGIPLLLGSATPLVEQYYLAQIGKLHLLELKERISGHFARQVVIDLKKESKLGYSIISLALSEEANTVLTKNEQILLYLNRRGIKSSVICTSCGYTETCPNCSMPLTLHATNAGLKMVCHYCYFSKPLVQECSRCKSKMLKGLGSGTHSVSEEARNLFPGHPIIIMDKDSTRKKGSHDAIFSQFEKKEADILIGTQMITKGWDISNVSLTGYLLLDSDMLFPSFRTSERVYQLITQFSGRSGRGEKQGTSVIQTYNPNNEVLQDALKNDYKSFYEKELKMRERLLYPPFSDLIQVTSRSKDEKQALRRLEKYIKSLLEELKRQSVKDDIVLLGPSRCFIPKVNNEYFMQYTIKVIKPTTLSMTDIRVPKNNEEASFIKDLYQEIGTDNPALEGIIKILNTISRQEGISVNIDPFELD